MAIVDNVIKGGDIVTFVYDGTNYNVIAINTDWKASVKIKGDENATISVTNQTFNISDTVILDSDGNGVYVVKIPGTYVFDVVEE